jgi:hypothetical protein
MPDILLIAVFSNSSDAFGLYFEELIDALTSKVANVLVIKVSCQNIILLGQIGKFQPIFLLQIQIKQINATGHNNQLARASKHLFLGWEFKVIDKRTLRFGPI